jgi:hypothetical protein
MSFRAEALARYVAANEAGLRWMLDRPRLDGVFLNTKLDPVTLTDRAADDVWRGPATTYGWIQGRGLEALLRHARFFRRVDAALAERLEDAARPLAARLRGLLDAHQGRAAFAYDAAMRPVRPGPDGAPVAQALSAAVATYSDIFVRKGLVAASASFEPERLAQDVAALEALGEDIEAGRFQIDEKAPIGAAAPPEDARHYGPRMILLGAGELLREVGCPELAEELARRIVPHVLERHVGQRLAADQIGGDACNPGHAIEFVGFAFEALGRAMDDATQSRLEALLDASFTAGFTGVGIRLSVSIATGRALQPLMPWWSLPETIKSAALAHERTGSARALAIWKQADDAFFRHYWRARPPVAYQTRDDHGPIDHAPATPDLDPGYHTGLALLGAIAVIDRIRAID